MMTERLYEVEWWSRGVTHTEVWYATSPRHARQQQWNAVKHCFPSNWTFADWLKGARVSTRLLRRKGAEG